MKPTSEQKAILEASARVIRINARAGTGKTTTLMMIAGQHPEKKILYLVFNKSAKQEAEKTFPRNVKVQTLHGLAWRNTGYKWSINPAGFTLADMLPAFSSHYKQDRYILAGMSQNFLTFFLNSPFKTLEQAVEQFVERVPEDKADMFDSFEKEIIENTRKIATEWNTGKRACPHDFYLKMFQINGQFTNVLNQYDIVLVDEGQDLSPVMMDALKNCRCRVYIVGDSHQQIYGFRYAIDAMTQLPCNEEYSLTSSFRFGKPIAELATLFIQEAKGEPQFRVRGNPEKKSNISFYHLPESKNEFQTSAFLTRTNLALFSMAMYLRRNGKPFYFERNINPLLFKALDIFRLSCGQREKIKDTFIKSFDTMDRLKTYAAEMEDFSIQGMIRIVARYSDDFPHAIFELWKQHDKKDTGSMILSTIHSAKGRQYEQVYIDEDLAEALTSASENNDSGPLREEANVAYVAFTRTRTQLNLPVLFQDSLSPKWQEWLKQFSYL